jgi:hypothetical protein
MIPTAALLKTRLIREVENALNVALGVGGGRLHASTAPRRAITMAPSVEEAAVPAGVRALSGCRAAGSSAPGRRRRASGCRRGLVPGGVKPPPIGHNIAIAEEPAHRAQGAGQSAALEVREEIVPPPHITNEKEPQ